MNPRPTTVLVVVSAFLASACGVASSPPAKDGGAARTVTLSAVAYTTNTLTGETLDELVRQVAASSKGAVGLEVVPPLDAGAQDGSADVIRMVRDGTADVGVVASRTFDLEGATSLQALNVPLAVDSPQQAAAFLADPVTEPMLAGLGKAGVVGLALTYDQLRQPLGFAGPVDPQALRGTRFLARPSAASAAVVAALGATADPRNGDDAEVAIAKGEVVGEETSMDRPSGFQSGSPGHTSAITGNVQLSVKANVIIANPKVWTGLSADQQRAVRDAATATRAWSTHQLVPLSTAARAFCSQHIGDVVIATPAQLRAWRAAVAPAVAALSSADAATAAALERLRQITVESPATDVPTACTMADPGALPSVAPEGDQTVVVGTWRLLVTAEQLAAAGASQQDVGLNQGTWTFTFEPDGSYRFTEPRGRSCPGTFAVAGNRLSMQERVGRGDCDGHWELTFTRTGDRLTLTPTPEFLRTWQPLRGFLANPLERVAGP